jgi:hypothetical protein
LYKLKIILYLHSQERKGTLAQMVEQWTENPCVPGSIPGGTTIPLKTSGIFCLNTLIINNLRYFDKNIYH